MTSIDKALKLIRACPRVGQFNISDLPRSKPSKYAGLQRKKRGFAHRGMSQYQAWQPLGHLIKKTPFYVTVPKEPYNANKWSRYPMKNLSLLELQRMIDLQRVDSEQLIDFTSISNTGLMKLNVVDDRIHGLDLTDEGIDAFTSPIVIEVQHASEHVIAAIERAGGMLVTRFYDLFSVFAKSNPIAFFKRGIPIPKARLPPENILEYYTSAENRGYLADPEKVACARLSLAQKYGYSPTDLSSSPVWLRDAAIELLSRDPRQIFSGLQPGSLVSLVDRCVLRPKDKELVNFYHT